LTSVKRLSQKEIFQFWLPLAATWMMMAVEGPFLAAVIARLPDPTFNLAAYGVTLAFAFLIEAPVVMLMTASTALAEDRERYVRLRSFAYGLNGLCTAAMMIVIVPPVFDFLALQVVSVPSEVARLTYGALWILLPWPAAIGYRRFYQGLLIRDGKTRLVALGTVVRLSSMAVASIVLYWVTSVPGAWVAAGGLAAGVTAEAVASRWMARGSVRKLMATDPIDVIPGWGRMDGEEDEAAEPLTLPRLVHFYTPLALTSLIGFAVHPMLTFFMGRAPEPIVSLAVFPVVNSLGFLFRTGGLAFQEVSIALIGRRYERLQELRSFALILGAVMSLGMALVALTPLAVFWFEVVSGLTPDLARYALLPTLILFPVPFFSAVLSLERGILVTAHRTRPITIATAIEVAIIASVFPLLGFGAGVVGVTAATGAFLVGRFGSAAFLVPFAVTAVRSRRTVAGRPVSEPTRVV
jgi:hypothetical protein